MIFFQVLLEMSPGMGVDKSILSVADLKSHSKDIGHWGPQELISALLKDGFSAKLKNPLTGEFETLCDLICFGSSEVGNLLAKFNRWKYIIVMSLSLNLVGLAFFLENSSFALGSTFWRKV